MRLGATRLAAVLGAVMLALALLAIPASRAAASSGQVSIIQDDPALERDPAGTLARMRLLGAQVVRVSVTWELIAPTPNATRPPRGFDASDPAAYPASRWTLWDTIVTDAHNDGITLDLDLMGGAPRWARGPGRPPNVHTDSWEPSASAFGAFVHAVGTRYSGTYVPPGGSAPLPRVDFWTVWNEPDYGPSLAPQGVPGHLTIENAPRMYRGLVDAAWSGLNASGHHTSTDTIAWGELAPRGESFWGVASGMTPLALNRAGCCARKRREAPAVVGQPRSFAAVPWSG